MDPDQIRGVQNLPFSLHLLHTCTAKLCCSKYRIITAIACVSEIFRFLQYIFENLFYFVNDLFSRTGGDWRFEDEITEDYHCRVLDFDPRYGSTFYPFFSWSTVEVQS